MKVNDETGRRREEPLSSCGSEVVVFNEVDGQDLGRLKFGRIDRLGGSCPCFEHSRMATAEH